jgi:hypothetical protein
MAAIASHLVLRKMKTSQNQTLETDIWWCLAKVYQFDMMMKIPSSLKLLNTRITFKANLTRIIIKMLGYYDAKRLFGFFAIWQLWYLFLDYLYLVMQRNVR